MQTARTKPSGGSAAWRPAGGRTAATAAGGIALWRQIAEDIETEIETGRLVAGQRLPAETDLAKRFGVNRHTLRRAMAELARKGLVEALAGRGTFVRAPRIAYPVGGMTRFSEVVAGAGHEPGGRLLASARITAPGDIGQWLALAAGAEVIEMEHLRAAGPVPICFATTWFPADRFPAIAEAYARRATITAALAEFGVANYRRTRTLVSARNANAAERNALALERGATVLVVDSLNVDAAGLPIQASHTRFASDRVQLVVESLPTNPARDGTANPGTDSDTAKA